MFKITIAGVTIEFANTKELADHFRRIGFNTRQKSMLQNTQKETRFYEGQAAAYLHVADILEIVEVK